MREPNHDDDPFRKVQKELEELELGTDPDLKAKVQSMIEEANDHGEAEQRENQEIASLHKKVADAAGTPLPDTDAFEESFRKLEAKANLSKGKRDRQEKAIAEERKHLRNDARGMGMGLTIAYAIVGVPMLGALVGWVLDAQTDSNIFKGLGALTGAVVGIGYAVYLMNRPAPKQ